MKISDLNSAISDANETYKEYLSNLISKSLNNLDEVKEMKELVPAFKSFMILHDWSGFNDGDAEYAIIRGVYY